MPPKTRLWAGSRRTSALVLVRVAPDRQVALRFHRSHPNQRGLVPTARGGLLKYKNTQDMDGLVVEDGHDFIAIIHPPGGFRAVRGDGGGVFPAAFSARLLADPQRR